MSIEVAIATNRFGLGAIPGQLGSQLGGQFAGQTGGITGDPKTWLLRQTVRPELALIAQPGLPNSAQAFRNFLDYAQIRRDARRVARSPAPPDMTNMADMNPIETAPNDVARAAAFGARSIGMEMDARITHALKTPAPFLERWTLFWSNALTMAAKNLQTVQFPGPYEREAIRPHVLGKFSDLLKSSVLHLGMLVYLDQIRSFGPTSPAAALSARRPQGRSLGLNENLAREILELHTLGADGGYTQNDVTQFAYALTGWTVHGLRNARPTGGQELGSVIFVPALHEPGTRTIMGQDFGANGANQARDILDWLARQPQTARRIAKAVATHFVSDTPPASLTDRLAQVFMRTEGDLQALAQALINSPEAWQPEAQKFKTPYEFLLSTLRASGTKEVSAAALRDTFQQLGQPPWRAPSPKGWPDTTDKWASPDAILKRVDWSNLAAEVISETMSPTAFAQAALGESLTPATRLAVSRAQDARQGIVLILMSPEFQRR